MGPDPLHPRLTRGFLEYAQHRGFFVDPARVRHPKDKPKVERSVPYARERFFKGAAFDSLAQLRSEAPKWCRDVAGRRIHGTTRRQPLLVFQAEERQALLPWDGSSPFNLNLPGRKRPTTSLSNPFLMAGKLSYTTSHGEAAMQ